MHFVVCVCAYVTCATGKKYLPGIFSWYLNLFGLVLYLINVILVIKAFDYELSVAKMSKILSIIIFFLPLSLIGVPIHEEFDNPIPKLL